MSVEGPSGEFNNPSNAMTMKTVTESAILGELTIQLNCQAQTSAETFATIPVVGGGNKASGSQPAAGKQNASDKQKGASGAKNSAKKDGTSANRDGSATSDDASASSTDANGLERVDEDVAAQDAENFEGEGTPGWLIAVIVIVCLAALGGIGYGIYYGVNKNKKKGQQKS